MTTYASFKPSVQFLEAGEKGQQFANAANNFRPFLPQEAHQSIEGVEKIAKAFTATGRALEHFGFDEAGPEFTASQVALNSNANSEEIGGESRTIVPIPIPPYYYYSDENETVGADGVRWFPLFQGGIHPEWGNQDGYLDAVDKIDADAFTISDRAFNDPLTGPQPSITNAVDDIEAEAVEDVGLRFRVTKRDGQSTLFEDFRKSLGGDVDPAEEASTKNNSVDNSLVSFSTLELVKEQGSNSFQDVAPVVTDPLAL